MAVWLSIDLSSALLMDSAHNPLVRRLANSLFERAIAAELNASRVSWCCKQSKHAQARVRALILVQKAWGAPCAKRDSGWINLQVASLLQSLVLNGIHRLNVKAFKCTFSVTDDVCQGWARKVKKDTGLIIWSSLVLNWNLSCMCDAPIALLSVATVWWANAKEILQPDLRPHKEDNAVPGLSHRNLQFLTHHDGSGSNKPMQKNILASMLITIMPE